MSSVDQWDPNLYDNQHSYVTRYGEAVIDLLQPQPGERILDLGCGTGHLTAQIAAAGADVTGLDASPEMVAQAQAAYPALSFRTGNAAAFTVDQPCDAIFSNAALHWVHPPEGVVASVWAALRPGGRFVAEFGGKGNVATFTTALFEALAAFDQPRPALPWYFPSVAEYAALLERQGFRVTFMAHFDRPTALTGEDAIANFIRQYTPALVAGLEATAYAALVAQVADRLRPTLYHDGGWWMDYVRLRFAAVRPA